MMMAYRLNRIVALSLCYNAAKNGRTGWNLVRRCCTCIHTIQRRQNEPKQWTLNDRNCLVKTIGFYQTPRRNQQTLASDFGAHLPSLKQMEHFLSSRKVIFEHGHTSLIANCPFCATSEEGSDKAKTLYINKTTGSHFCTNCGSSGSWRQFKTACQGSHSQKGNISPAESNSTKSNDDLARQIWEKSTPLSQCSDSVWEKLIAQFSIKELKRDMLEKYQVRFREHEFKEPNGKTKSYDCVLFPWYDASKSAVKGVKLVKLQETNSSDANIAVEPRQGFVGLFGWNTVDPEAKEVVLTSTEFDAIAVNQSTSYPAISLPLGTNSLPLEVLPQLEQFEKIILWFGNDVLSRHVANQFAKKLNLQRCFLVRPANDSTTPGDALEALNQDCDLTSLVSAAQPISHEKITTFHQLRSEVLDQIVNADQAAGVKWTRFPKLNNILKGLRRGEVTVFTGPTGAGKTTFNY